MKIGVFDSGVGGLSVANAIKSALPVHETVLREDKANLPYGTKSPEQLYALVLPILERMVEEGCEIIVIACNTVTTNIIAELRAALTVPLIGIEPMIKPAAERTQSSIIAVFATPATLRSRRYAWLKAEYAAGVEVLEPDVSDWAEMIERNTINRDKIAKIIDTVLQKNADVVVLGCTHYHWIEALIEELVAGKAEVLQPEQAVIARLTAMISPLR
jgi:glutamate racemase